MSDLSLVLLAGGNSSRFGMGVRKQWLRIDQTPLWLHVARTFESMGIFEKIVITAHPDDVLYAQNHTAHTVVAAGKERQDSLKNALSHIDTPYVMVSDVARACVTPALIHRIIAAKEQADCIVSFLPIWDTVVYDDATIAREKLKIIQTPQLSKTHILKKALQSETIFTDDSSAIVAFGGTRAFVEGEEGAHKITRAADLLKLPCITPPSNKVLVGNGYDVHAFQEGKPMVLGGIGMPLLPYGFKAHSDGDVAIHALIDAILGAAGMDDIGTLFPDTDAAYADIDSKKLLSHVMTRITQVGFELGNVDITIVAQQPKIAPHKRDMRASLSALLSLPLERVNVKATTTEGLGFTGRKEGVAVIATATLYYTNWTHA
ncbi:MAG: 2-C-methyl-D-erythritol 4-phosphate cytidylyltransferase [Sulfuricurvum sp. PC08-66]|nr:MAG: 2-C-methyl-D-erythritol 4-phosphate cytidylyltransferase [Sulfuricurvum sp. PC08-66]